MSARDIVQIQMERLRLGKYEQAEKKSLHLKNFGGVSQQGEVDEMRDTVLKRNNNVSGGKDNNDEYKSTLSVANAILGGDPYWQQLVGQVCIILYVFLFLPSSYSAGEWCSKNAAS